MRKQAEEFQVQEVLSLKIIGMKLSDGTHGQAKMISRRLKLLIHQLILRLERM